MDLNQIDTRFKFVSYAKEQSLNDDEKRIAAKNIGVSNGTALVIAEDTLTKQGEFTAPQYVFTNGKRQYAIYMDDKTIEVHMQLSGIFTDIDLVPIDIDDSDVSYTIVDDPVHDLQTTRKRVITMTNHTWQGINLISTSDFGQTPFKLVWNGDGHDYCFVEHHETTVPKVECMEGVLTFKDNELKFIPINLSKYLLKSQAESRYAPKSTVTRMSVKVNHYDTPYSLDFSNNQAALIDRDGNQIGNIEINWEGNTPSLIIYASNNDWTWKNCRVDKSGDEVITVHDVTYESELENASLGIKLTAMNWKNHKTIQEWCASDYDDETVSDIELLHPGTLYVDEVGNIKTEFKSKIDEHTAFLNEGGFNWDFTDEALGMCLHLRWDKSGNILSFLTDTTCEFRYLGPEDCIGETCMGHDWNLFDDRLISSAWENVRPFYLRITDDTDDSKFMIFKFTIERCCGEEPDYWLFTARRVK